MITNTHTVQFLVLEGLLHCCLYPAHDVLHVVALNGSVQLHGMSG